MFVIPNTNEILVKHDELLFMEQLISHKHYQIMLLIITNNIHITCQNVNFSLAGLVCLGKSVRGTEMPYQLFGQLWERWFDFV